MKILKTHYTETELKDCFVDDKLQFKSERERKSFTPVTTSVSSPVYPEAILYEASKTNSSSLTTASTFTISNTSTSTATGKEDSVRIREREEESLIGVISSSSVFEEKHQEFTPAFTTVDDDNKIDKEETVTLHTENVLKYSSTDSFSIIGDQGTTPSSVLPSKCTEAEFLENRNNYERCASNKIREITAWLDRREHRLRNDDSSSSDDDKRSIMTVCNAVRQLLYDCGDELGWCFTEDQVTKTRYKQKAGLEDILSKYYSPDTLKMCFIQKKVSILLTTTQEAIPEMVSQEEKVFRSRKYYPKVSSYSRGCRENLSIITALSLLFALLPIL